MVQTLHRLLQEIFKNAPLVILNIKKNEREFFESWGEQKIQFHEERRFIRNFGVGFNLWIKKKNQAN